MTDRGARRSAGRLIVAVGGRAGGLATLLVHRGTAAAATVTEPRDAQAARQAPPTARLADDAVRLLRKGAHIEEPGEPRQGIGDSLDWFIGSWTEEQARELEQAVADFSPRSWWAS